ncbi:MAG: hypothetical protein IJ562_12800, partial [Prevotella sp.]|nr:hypothetical protein [Prevotella sp.]
MKNKYLGIIIMVAVVAALVTVGILSHHHVEKMAEHHIPEHDFYKYISEKSNKQIASVSSHNAAHNAYLRLYAEVNTEANITLMSGKELIGASMAEDCYEKIYADYFPHFGAKANDLFGSTKWGKSQLESIKMEAGDLLNREGCTFARDSLQRCVDYVKGYYDALNIKSIASRCREESVYRRVVSRASKYNSVPYTNSSEIGSDFKSRIQTMARENWNKSIEVDMKSFVRKCDTSYSRCGFYSSEDCKNELDWIMGQIQSFYNVCGVAIDYAAINAGYKKVTVFFDKR